MVKQVIVDNANAYQCEICKLAYKNKDIAEKCEEFCDKYKSCSLKITKYAINKNSMKK